MSQRVYNRLSRDVPRQPGEPADQPERLGSVISEYLDRNIAPRQADWEALQQSWDELVPENIAGHCRLAGVEDGRLIIAVDSPGYAHELRLVGGVIIKQLNRRVPQLKIKKVMTVPG